ncbi:MAG: YbhN family protein [Alphaproteobacteria bacterium]
MSANAPIRRLAGFAARASVTLLLLWLLAAKVDLAAVGQALKGASPAWVAAAFILVSLQALLATGRWALVCRILGHALPFLAVLRFSLIGLFFNQCLPSAVGGDAVRVWLAQRAGLALGGAMRSVLLDRMAGLGGLTLITAAALPALLQRVDNPAMQTGIALCIALVAALFALILVADRVPGFPLRFRVARALADLGEDARKLMLRPGAAARVVGISLAVHLLIVAAVYALARALGIAAGFVDCLALVPPVILASAIPVSLAGWGVREGAMVAAFGFIGVAAYQALALSVALGLALLAVGIPGGVLWLTGGSPVRAKPQ